MFSPGVRRMYGVPLTLSRVPRTVICNPMARVRTPKIKESQAAYEAEKLAAGEHIQINVKLKAAKDVAGFQGLRERFPDMTDTAIARLAIRELAAKKGNR